MGLPQVIQSGGKFISASNSASDVVNLGSKAYTIGSAAKGAGSLAKIFSVGSKMTNWIGWGVLAFEGIQLVSDVITAVFKDNGISVKETDVSKFMALNGELFVYSHILLNIDLSSKFTFNIFDADISTFVDDLNEDGKVDIVDLILKDVKALPLKDGALKDRIEDAIENNDIEGYIRTILAAKAGTPSFPTLIESLYKNWLTFCYDKNIWRAFPPAYQTRVQAIQHLVDKIYHISIIDANVASYVHNYSEYSFTAIQEEVLENLPYIDEDRYENIFDSRDFLWEVVPNVGSFRN